MNGTSPSNHDARQPRRRWVGLALRLGMTVLGLTLVARSLTWTDRVEVAAGAAVAGQTFAAAAALPVVEHTSGGVRVALPGGGVGEVEAAAFAERRATLRPSIVTTLRGAAWPWLLAAVAFTGARLVVQSHRWWLLLRSQRLDVTWSAALRYTLIGLLFSNFLPGMTGGDVARAWYVARGSHRAAATVVTVVMDRALGLGALLVLALASGWWLVREHLTAAQGWVAGGVIVVGAVLLLAYFSLPLRRALGLDALIQRLPRGGPLGRAKSAAGAYRRHPRTVAAAVVLSFAVHGLMMLSAACGGWAVGLTTPLWLLLLGLPPVLIAGGLPISIMGLGVMEPAGIALLTSAGMATVDQVVAMLLLIRVYQVVYSLPGAACVLLEGRPAPRGAAAAADDIAVEPAPAP